MLKKTQVEDLESLPLIDKPHQSLILDDEEYDITRIRTDLNHAKNKFIVDPATNSRVAVHEDRELQNKTAFDELFYYFDCIKGLFSKARTDELFEHARKKNLADLSAYLKKITKEEEEHMTELKKASLTLEQLKQTFTDMYYACEIDENGEFINGGGTKMTSTDFMMLKRELRNAQTNVSYFDRIHKVALNAKEETMSNILLILEARTSTELSRIMTKYDNALNINPEALIKMVDKDIDRNIKINDTHMAMRQLYTERVVNSESFAYTQDNEVDGILFECKTAAMKRRENNIKDLPFIKTKRNNNNNNKPPPDDSTSTGWIEAAGAQML